MKYRPTTKVAKTAKEPAADPLLIEQRIAPQSARLRRAGKALDALMNK
jgi:hypothetical protein